LFCHAALRVGGLDHLGRAIVLLNHKNGGVVKRFFALGVFPYKN